MHLMNDNLAKLLISIYSKAELFILDILIIHINWFYITSFEIVHIEEGLRLDS